MRKETSKAKPATASAILHALSRVKSTHIRLVVLGIWKYQANGSDEFGWKAVRVIRSQLLAQVAEIQSDVQGFRDAQIRSAGGAPSRSERREIETTTDALEQELLRQLANDTFGQASGVLSLEQFWAWSIAAS